jgi:hypothetical protein
MEVDGAPTRDDDRPLGEVAALAKTAAEDYRQRARFPPWAHPLEEGEDPLLRDRQVSPITSRGPRGEEPAITVFPDQVGFEGPEPVKLYAYLSVNGQRAPAREVRGVVLTEDMQEIGGVVYRDDGDGGDATANDYLYTAVFEPSSAMQERLSASYLVQVTALTPEGEERRVATSFLYSNPHSRLTGSFRDSLVEGNLVIEAEVEVRQGGRFHLEATLYGDDGRTPIVWSQQAEEFEPGRHWMRLQYPGLAFREKGVDGPYVLRFAALSTTTQMPNAKNRLVENGHVTGPYRVDEFSAEPFNDPDLLEAARQIEQDFAGAPQAADASGPAAHALDP